MTENKQEAPQNGVYIVPLNPAEADLVDRAAKVFYAEPLEWVKNALLSAAQEVVAVHRQAVPLAQLAKTGQGFTLPEAKLPGPTPQGMPAQPSTLSAPSPRAPIVAESLQPRAAVPTVGQGGQGNPNLVPELGFSRHPCKFLSRQLPPGFSAQTCFGSCNSQRLGQEHCNWKSNLATQCSGYEPKERGGPRGQNQW